MANADSSPSVLFVSPGPSLVQPASGQGTRLKHLSQNLADDWNVFALVPETTDDPEWVQQTYTYEQWSLPFLTDLNPSFVVALERVLREQEIDIVHLSIGVCMASVMTRLRETGTTVVYGAQNVEAEHARDFVDDSLPIYKRVIGPRLIPWIERLTVACTDCMTTVSEADRETFIDRFGIERDHIRAIPTGTQEINTDELPSRESIREKYGLTAETIAVFHGSYSHPPNQEAVGLIQNTIAPAVRERGLDVEFLLVGKEAPDVSAENVHSVGFVDDLFGTLYAADFAVMPIRHGAGTKTKLYDYISLGLPIVATEKSVEGIDIMAGEHGIVTDGVNDSFVDGIETLTTDPKRRAELETNLQSLSTHLSWSGSTERLDQFYRTISTYRMTEDSTRTR